MTFFESIGGNGWLNADASLLIVTNKSVIARLDIRTMEISTRFQHPLELGVVTATCPSTHWLVIGTDAGTLSLWDLRFGLLLLSWRARGPITSIQIHPSRGFGRWIMVSSKRKQEGPIVEVYDIEDGKLVEAYEVRATRPTSKDAPLPTAPQPPISKREYLEELLREQDSLGASEEDSLNATPSVISLVVGSSFASLVHRDDDGGGLLMPVPEGKMAKANPGWMITAGEDRVVRYWDLVKASEGFVICGSPKEKDVQFRWV
jgi:phosphoinositide-3-kinase regulatory subunit 4